MIQNIYMTYIQWGCSCSADRIVPNAGIVPVKSLATTGIRCRTLKPVSVHIPNSAGVRYNAGIIIGWHIPALQRATAWSNEIMGCLLTVIKLS